MKESGLKIRNKDKEHINGLWEDNTRATGIEIK